MDRCSWRSVPATDDAEEKEQDSDEEHEDGSGDAREAVWLRGVSVTTRDWRPTRATMPQRRSSFFSIEGRDSGERSAQEQQVQK